MIRVRQSFVQGVTQAEGGVDLHPYLQAAMKLEHSTIPLYLTAYLSLQPGTNDQVGTVIRSVILEEMLHLSIAANVLNAVGGRPEIDTPAFVPSFPGPLPMGIDGDLVLHLAPMSMAQCDAFMDIEEPEDPIEFRALAAVGPEEGFATIGTFYQAIIEKLQELGDSAFRDPSNPQVTGSWFPDTELFAVTDVASATRALDLVVEQGEGTKTSPLDAQGDIAHYYRFSEIKHANRLVPDASAPNGFSYTGDPLPFDGSKVWPLVTDPRPDRYPEGTAARRLVDQFNRSYTTLLRALHETFNGRPGHLDATIGLMYELRLDALQMVTEADPLDGSLCVTPTWQYLDPTP
jgi:hypothetical protein